MRGKSGCVVGWFENRERRCNRFVSHRMQERLARAWGVRWRWGVSLSLCGRWAAQKKRGVWPSMSEVGLRLGAQWWRLLDVVVVATRIVLCVANVKSDKRSVLMTLVNNADVVRECLMAEGSLLRVSSSVDGVEWFLAPSNHRVATSIAELVAAEEWIICLDEPVGRIVWEYVAVEREHAARLAREGDSAPPSGSTLDSGCRNQPCSNDGCGCRSPDPHYLADIPIRLRSPKD